MSSRVWSVRSLGFFILPLAGLLTPLLAIPAITSQFGASGWAAVAIGQSIGTAVAVLVELGWGLSGPQRVARLADNAAYRLLAYALQTKFIVYAPLAVVSGFLAYSLAHSHNIEAALVAVGFSSMGLTASWYFVGRTRPWLLLGTEGLCRFVAIAIASALLLLGAPLIVYPLVGLIVPAFLAPLFALLVARRGSNVKAMFLSPARLLFMIRAQGSAVSARAVSSIYIALPVALVSIVSPSSVAIFAAGERLLRITLGGLAAVPNSLQGWVGGSSTRAVRVRRAELAVLINVGLGVVAAVIFGLLAPFASKLIFTNAATIPPELAWAVAAVLFVVCISRSTGNIALVALGRVKYVLVSALAGALIGTPALLLLAHLMGAVGAAVAELVSEALVLAIQGSVILRDRKRPATRPAAARSAEP
ncbi:polysaccharide biosynthesis C-terminal domain-containing protein [Paramicrobacterium chengjingii]|uniref:polysaccharide biosynthesis C-terminal domain-containing protein n=1 Tax=Paramicrobacterium chengjingii TaxID=2769067 RepID=UPI00142224D2|nr:polysaccharide biosynthesis C-terminal domain-containing protein [Microbacterium chengjingii]